MEQLPRYSDPFGVYSTLPLCPPFFFQGMTARVFPLRASPFQIDVLCDQYVNFIPPELGRFRAFLPFVYLMVIDYGKLAAPVANVGWLSQYEIMFAVPVEWYRVVGGRWEFQTWAWLTPFIYVDSELSLLLGRQTYGWEKSLVRLAPAPSQWMNDPLSSVSRATVGAKVLPEMFVGDRQVPRTIIEISQDAGLLTSRFPPDMKSPLAPWIALGNAVQTSAALMGDLAEILTGMGLTRKRPGADPESFTKMAALAAEMLNPYDPQIVFNTINLKQFRDSQRPTDYCYQSVNNAPMRLQQVNAIGLLGDVNQLAGDASGGFRIDLHQYPAYPIVEMLGLEVSRRWRGDGVDVAQLEPVFPFWYNVDMVYGRGVTLAWRTFDAVWRGPDGSAHPAGPRSENDRRFNSTLGVSSSQAAAGVFTFTNTTMRVLPLLAAKAKLQAFLDEYLNEPLATGGAEPPYRFEVWGPPEAGDPYAYVYMVATDYGTMVSPEANIGSWQSESLSILVPVRWMQGGVLRGLGLVPAYTFTNSNEAVISSWEVLGIPMTKGDFVSPPNMWMSTEVLLSANQPLLRISADVLPLVGSGQQAQRRQVVEIAKGPILPASDEGAWDRMAMIPLRALYREQRRKRAMREDDGREPSIKDGRSLAIEVLAHDVPIHFFTLKQFRDVTSPQDACYQSLVRVPNQITHLYDLQEIEHPLHVEIREYPSLPIMRLLGLVGHLSADQGGGGVVHKLVPVRPFWVRMSWKQGLGRRLAYRCGSEKWTNEPLPPSYFDGDGRRTLPLRKMDRLFAIGDPSEIRALVQDSIDMALQDDEALSAARAREVVGEIDPQMILESILSREWAHHGENARWRQAHRALSAQLARTIETAPSHQRTRLVISFFQDLARQTVQRYDLKPGTKARQRIDEAVESFASFERACAAAGEAYDHLVTLATPTAGGESEGGGDDAGPEQGAGQHARPGGAPDDDAYSKDLVALADNVYRSLCIACELESPSDKKKRLGVMHKVEDLVRETISHVATRQAQAVIRLTEQTVLGMFGLPAAAGQGSPPGPVPPGGGAPSGVHVDALWAWFRENKKLVQDIVQLLGEERERRRASLLTMFTKAAQKPDYCASRDAAGPHAERIFPLHASWDEHWFTGKNVGDPPPEEGGGPVCG